MYSSPKTGLNCVPWLIESFRMYHSPCESCLFCTRLLPRCVSSAYVKCVCVCAFSCTALGVLFLILFVWIANMRRLYRQKNVKNRKSLKFSRYVSRGGCGGAQIHASSPRKMQFFSLWNIVAPSVCAFLIPLLTFYFRWFSRIFFIRFSCSPLLTLLLLLLLKSFSLKIAYWNPCISASLVPYFDYFYFHCIVKKTTTFFIYHPGGRADVLLSYVAQKDLHSIRLCLFQLL